MNDIPVVDFEACGIHHSLINEKEDLKNLGKLICDAFVNCGFVYLTNTGISSDSVDELNGVTGSFFHSPNQEKLKYTRQENNHGYDFIGSESLNDNQPGDYKESYNMTCKSAEEEGYIWPDDIAPNFSKISFEFMRKCKTLTLRIMDAISLGLEMQDTKFLSRCHSSVMKSNNNSSLRCLHYPPMPKKVEKDQVRLCEHTDYGTLTLLFQDSVGGLQIRKRDGTYIDAHPIKDSILVNVADLLQYWTGGVLKSTPHRIIGTGDPESLNKVRRSIAFFVHPTGDLPVSLDLLGDPEKGVKRDRDESPDKSRAVFRSQALRNISPEMLKQMTVGEYVNLHFTRNYSRK